MIPRNAQTWQGQRPSWQQQLTDSVRQAQDLLNILGLENLDVPNIKQFPMRVPMDFVMRMEKNNANDPLLRQVLPLDAEKQIHPGFSIDPVGDQAASPHQGIIHKYQGRLLLTLTGACAVHCRYCFRRHYPYSTSNPIKNQWLQTLNYIRLHQDLHEVILSGGDPLMLSDEQLADIIRDIANIPHIRHLRIHSRLPIVLPARITHTLCQILEQSSLTIVMVVHCNHPNELSENVKQGLRLLHEHNIHLLNQSVLLAGVNDDAEVLANLSWRLFNYQVSPYYLHQLDPVQGAAHFQVTPDKAKQLYQTLQGQIPGYLLPKFVYEKPGSRYKINVL